VIQYDEFTRNFYSEHEEITNLSSQQVDKIRKDLQIKIKGTAPCRPIISFAHLGFDEALMDKIRSQKFVTPTAI
jgi:ATP-dependent RNA helicase DDX42